MLETDKPAETGSSFVVAKDQVTDWLHLRGPGCSFRVYENILKLCKWKFSSVKKLKTIYLGKMYGCELYPQT